MAALCGNLLGGFSFKNICGRRRVTVARYRMICFVLLIFLINHILYVMNFTTSRFGWLFSLVSIRILIHKFKCVSVLLQNSYGCVGRLGLYIRLTMFTVLWSFRPAIVVLCKSIFLWRLCVVAVSLAMSVLGYMSRHRIEQSKNMTKVHIFIGYVYIHVVQSSEKNNVAL